MADLSNKSKRSSLKIQREPHWQKLGAGAYLGFRRGPDTWIARFRTHDGKQKYQSLAVMTDDGDMSRRRDEYVDAKARAEAWFKQLGSTAVRTTKHGTVREALETYLRWLREQGRDDTAKNSESRFQSIVWKDPLAVIPLADLRREDMRDWRDRLREGRQPRSINRHVRSIVAGLNRAHDEGHVGNPEAWRLPPLADDVDGGDTSETAVMLSPEQRRALRDAAAPATAKFVRGLELTGARPGELAAATAADLDEKDGTLMLRHRKGRPAKIRTRVVVLSVDGAAFFAEIAKDKAPNALLFTDPAGKPWERGEWARELRAAVAIHNAKAKGKKRIPEGASAYSFRHARISELLQVHGIDPLTVAMQTGTSLKMIERAYFRFIPTAMKAKLAAIADT